MSGALKTGIDIDRADFEIPENFEKHVQELRHQKQSFEGQLSHAKSALSQKKNDENTNVYQLREREALSKVRELELKKAKIEKELNALLQQKNTKLHEHLVKVTDVLVSEARKILPLEKDIESGVTKLSHLKNEMQQMFENNIDDRKKNASQIEEQMKEIRSVNQLLRESTSILSKDYHLLTTELEKLHREKIDLMESLSKIKDQISSQTSVLKLLDEKEQQLKKIEEALSEFNQKSNEMAQTQVYFEDLKSQIARLKSDKDELLRLNNSAKSKKEELSTTLSRTEISLRHLEQEIEAKRDDLQRLNQDFIETKIKVENMRNEEFEMLKNLKNHQASLTEIMKEASFLKASTDQAIKMQEDALAFLEERKAFYRREVELIEDNYRLLSTKLEAEFQTKKLEWEKDYSLYIEKRERELKKNFDEMRFQEQETMTKKRKALASEILEIFKKQDRHQGFVSQEQKAEEVKKDIMGLFDNYFGKKRSWWKFWS